MLVLVEGLAMIPFGTHIAAAAIAAALAFGAAWHVQAWRYDALIADMLGSYEAQESERRRVALDDARDTFRKGEIHARNQQEIADEHAVQEKRRLARLAAAAADGERLRGLEDRRDTTAELCAEWGKDGHFSERLIARAKP